MKKNEKCARKTLGRTEKERRSMVDWRMLNRLWRFVINLLTIVDGADKIWVENKVWWFGIEKCLTLYTKMIFVIIAFVGSV